MHLPTKKISKGFLKIQGIVTLSTVLSNIIVTGAVLDKGKLKIHRGTIL